eukprot:XP_011679258.1 PREDICTED: serine/threonine-protein phosphatase 6 regulatory ankyrin repeat subunit B-like [Strongylocentrotus purpuratus]
MDEVNQEIHEAVLRGNLKAVERLLKIGLNINQTDQNGDTPLHIAVQTGLEDVIEYLINHGADVEKATPDGQTPLQLSASLGRLKATQCVLINGANVDKEDKDGYSALYSALRPGYELTRYSPWPSKMVTSHHVRSFCEGFDDLIYPVTLTGQTCLHEAIKLCQ